MYHAHLPHYLSSQMSRSRGNRSPTNGTEAFGYKSTTRSSNRLMSAEKTLKLYSSAPLLSRTGPPKADTFGRSITRLKERSITVSAVTPFRTCSGGSTTEWWIISSQELWSSNVVMHESSQSLAVVILMVIVLHRHQQHRPIWSDKRRRHSPRHHRTGRSAADKTTE